MVVGHLYNSDRARLADPHAYPSQKVQPRSQPTAAFTPHFYSNATFRIAPYSYPWMETSYGWHEEANEKTDCSFFYDLLGERWFGSKLR